MYPKWTKNLPSNEILSRTGWNKKYDSKYIRAYIIFLGIFEMILVKIQTMVNWTFNTTCQSNRVANVTEQVLGKIVLI